MLSLIFVFNEYSTSNNSTFTGTENYMMSTTPMMTTTLKTTTNNSTHDNTGDSNTTDDNTVYTTNNFDRNDFTTFYNICQFTTCIVNVS